jgi:hypothetical protein
MTDTQLAVADEAEGGAVIASPGGMLASLMQLARDPQVRPDVVAAFIGLQERLEDRQAERAYNEAFIRLQPALPRIKRDGSLMYPVDKNNPTGPQREISKYAKWESIDAAIRPVLTEHGFALNFRVEPRPDGGGLIVTAILRHQAGHKTEASIPVPLDTSGGKNNLQGYGSSLSYGQRYSAKAVLNLITEGEDDDGNRGGLRFITDAQAEELRGLCKDAGRQEGPFLDHLFAGAVRSFEEIEEGSGFVAAKSTLLGIIRQKQKKATKGDAA